MLKGQDHLQKVARLPIHLHPQKGQLVVGGGVKGLVVAGIHLLSAVASHQLATKAHRHLLQLHLLCTHASYQQTWFCTWKRKKRKEKATPFGVDLTKSQV